MEGCYRCGSEQGDEARLCPDCNTLKLQSRGALPQAESESTSYSLMDLLQVSRTRALKGAASVLIISAFLLLNIETLHSYFAVPTPEELYQECMNHLGQKVADDDAVVAIDSTVFSEVESELCANLKTTCVSEPDGESCSKTRTVMQRIAHK